MNYIRTGGDAAATHYSDGHGATLTLPGGGHPAVLDVTIRAQAEALPARLPGESESAYMYRVVGPDPAHAALIAARPVCTNRDPFAGIPNADDAERHQFSVRHTAGGAR